MYPVAGEPGRDVQAARGRATQRARRRPHPRRPTGILLPGAFPPKAWISRQQTHCSTIRRASQAPDALPWKGASRPRFRSRASVRPAGTGKTPCVPREAAVSVAFPIPPRITFRSIDSGRPALHGGALSLPPPRFLEGPCLVLVPRPRRRRRALPEKERRAESQSGRNAAETRQKRGRIGAESDRVRVRAMKGHGRHAPQTDRLRGIPSTRWHPVPYGAAEASAPLDAAPRGAGSPPATTTGGHSIYVQGMKAQRSERRCDGCRTANGGAVVTASSSYAAIESRWGQHTRPGQRRYNYAAPSLRCNHQRIVLVVAAYRMAELQE